MEFAPTTFLLSSKYHRNLAQPPFPFRPNAIEIRSNYLPLSSKCHRNLVQPPFRFHVNAGEQFFRFRWIILLKPFGCSSNSLAALLLISFLILLRLFRCFLWPKEDGVVVRDEL